MMRRNYFAFLTVAACLACRLLVGFKTEILFLIIFSGTEDHQPHGGSAARIIEGDSETNHANQTLHRHRHEFDFPVFNTSSKNTNVPKPAPLVVLEQYLEWHSVESLRREPRNRKFSVVFYSCPLQAGNRLHHFLTGMYWSIVTNRTMLWKYWDTKSCSRYGADYNPLICSEANTVADCDPILARAPWIPSYDEWHGRLGLPEPYELPFYSTHPRHVYNARYPWGPGNDEQVQGVDVTFREMPLVVFNQTRKMLRFMAKPEISRALLHSEWSRTISDTLYSQGPEFLFGMLQRYSFDVTEPIKASIPQRPHDLQDLTRYYTIALHSRHTDPSDDGCNVTREQMCLEGLSPQYRGSNNRTCVVSLMSDRPCTLEAMAAWLPKQGCQVLVASHENSSDFLSEHGPFAGAGFFQDLALASMARSAFVGMMRSSSDVVLELVAFLRKMEAWHSAVNSGASSTTVEEAVTEAHVEFCRLDGPPPGQATTTVAAVTRARPPSADEFEEPLADMA